MSHHPQVALRKAREKSGIQVRRKHVALRRYALVQPLCNRSVAGADLPARPAWRETDTLEARVRDRIEDPCQQLQPLAGDGIAVVEHVVGGAHSSSAAAACRGSTRKRLVARPRMHAMTATAAAANASFELALAPGA